MDRLTEAKYFDITEGYVNGQLNSQYSTDNKFKEAIQYDLRGNITGLQRNGFKNGAWTTNNYTAGEYTQIDNLSYIYNSKNQVTSIIDGAVNFSGLSGTKDYKGFVYNPAEVNVTGGNHYTYDNNGNLITDFHKDIDLIEYNFLNLPQVITFKGGRTIKFVYDASGAKLRKITNDNGVETTYDYINGVEYKNGSLQRFAHTEGAVVRNDFGFFEHNYVLRDHLGNARVTFTDGTNYGDPFYIFEWYFDWYTFQYFQTVQYIDPNSWNPTGYNDGVITAADIKQVNNYYAFGLNMEGNWQGGAQGANKYQYNEKELNDDFGLNWNDYGARMYDAAMARWVAVDPMSEKMSPHSPYNYTFNNPIRFIDTDGNKPTDFVILIAKDGARGHGHMGAVIQDGKGKYYYVTMGMRLDDQHPSSWARTLKSAIFGTSGNMHYYPLKGNNMADAVSEAKRDENNSPYTDEIRFFTNAQTDAKIFETIKWETNDVQIGDTKYHMLRYNCTDAIERSIEEATGVSLPNTFLPNKNFQQLVDRKKQVQATLDAQTPTASLPSIPLKPVKSVTKLGE